MTASPHVKPKGVTGHLAYLDALRGIACLAVLLFHNAGGKATDQVISQNHVHGLHALISGTLGFGWLGVHLFLVLSGFCLFYPIVRKCPLSEVHLDFGIFMKRRARRILPPYYASIVVVFVVALLAHRPIRLSGWYDLPMHVLMLQNLSTGTTVTINNTFWSLALEWQMYLIFPLLVLWSRHWGIFSLTLCSLALSVVWQTLVARLIGLHPPWPDVVDLYRAVPGFAYVFIVGMYAATLVAHPKRSYVAPATVIAVVTAIPALVYAVRVSSVGPLVDVAWGTIFAAFIVACAPFSERHLSENRAFRPLEFLGMFSYSLYLMHLPLMGWFDMLAAHLHLRGSVIQIWSWGRVIPIIGFAYLFFIAFERPFLVKRKNETFAETVRDATLAPAP